MIHPKSNRAPLAAIPQGKKYHTVIVVTLMYYHILYVIYAIKYYSSLYTVWTIFLCVFKSICRQLSRCIPFRHIHIYLVREYRNTHKHNVCIWWKNFIYICIYIYIYIYSYIHTYQNWSREYHLSEPVNVSESPRVPDTTSLNIFSNEGQVL